MKEKGFKLLETAKKQGKLSDQLRSNISRATTMDEIESLAIPFKAGSKKSLAAKATEAGLQETALNLLRGEKVANLASLVDMTKDGRKTEKDVEDGIVQILAEEIAHNAETIKMVKELEANGNATISTSKVSRFS